MEDLQRDVYLLTHDDPRSGFARRMEQMHFSASGDCFSREGKAAPLVLVAPVPVDADTAASVATLISLAKGWDTQGTAKRSVFLCLEGGKIAEGERIDIGPMAPGALSFGPPIHAGVPLTTRPIEGLDYRALAAQVATIFERLDR